MLPLKRVLLTTAARKHLLTEYSQSLPSPKRGDGYWLGQIAKRILLLSSAWISEKLAAKSRSFIVRKAWKETMIACENLAVHRIPSLQQLEHCRVSTPLDRQISKMTEEEHGRESLISGRNLKERLNQNLRYQWLRHRFPCLSSPIFHPSRRNVRQQLNYRIRHRLPSFIHSARPREVQTYRRKQCKNRRLFEKGMIK